MPSGDDVTGLHAFDDLDPVSTVSALNVMPEPEAHPALPQMISQPEYGAPSEPPPRPSTLPPPAPRAAARPGAAAALPPPPPRGGMASASVPPPPAARRADEGSLDFDEEGDASEDTKVVAQSDYVYDEYEHPAGDTGSLAAADVRDLTPASTAHTGAGIDDTELLELSATTVATRIEMDWDEEEVETKLRDDADPAGLTPAQTLPPGGRASPFPPPVTSSASYPGNPSPFASRSSFPPPVVVAPEMDAWGGEDALTRVMRSPLPPPAQLPEEWNRSGAREAVRGDETLTGTSWQELVSNKRHTMIGFGVVGLIALVIVARVLFSSPDTATVTLTTSPSDAQVIVDGQLLSGQTSPFTLQGLSPSVAHSIEVRKDGYVTIKQSFEVQPGEVKPLAGIELAPLRVDTGFALSSAPGGASVYVDDKKLDGVTPLRVTDMSEGLHVVRLELSSGYQPWETQVALAKGQVIELPMARLVPSAPGAARRAAAVADATPAPKASSSSSSSSSSSHHSSSHASAPRAPSSVPGPSFMPQPSAPRAAPAPVAAAGGNQGTLRVNSRPWSQVFIDGRMIGNTPQLNVPLSPGKHKVKLVNPQLGMSKGFDVNIAAGKPTTKIVELME